MSCVVSIHIGVKWLKSGSIVIKKGVIYYMDTMQFDNGAKRGEKGKLNR